MAVNSAGAAAKDLPLMANVDDIRVKHYMIKLTLKDSWDLKTFQGVLVIFLEPPTTDANNEPPTSSSEKKVEFVCVLDCCDLKVSNVEEVSHDSAALDELLDWRNNNYSKQMMSDWLRRPGHQLTFSATKWSLQIRKCGAYSAKDFPRAVRITYETSSMGASLTWTHDQSSRPCVFTQGAWINNRSLFPCQEPPVAMATWQALVTAPPGSVVLMTGDEEPNVTPELNDWNTFYFCTTMVLPMSTLAIAVGYWECAVIVSEEEADTSQVTTDLMNDLLCRHDDYVCYLRRSKMHSLIPVRVFAAKHLLSKFVQEFGSYIPRCLHAAYHMLGPHPFPRLNILVAPTSFASLGFASPHLLLVSQSLLVGDGSMAVRLAHEVSHSWFGLSIGALDWTEEWLSEGFATYAEDIIHANAMQLSCQERLERSELRVLIRHRVLTAELENTDLELQTLRPNVGDREATGSAGFVKNGMNPDKSCTQVHYLKGYFLLRHLSKSVGEDEFCSFLKEYVIRCHGQLVLSKEILDNFFQKFPNLKSVDKESVYVDWLDNPGMPKVLIDILPNKNKLHENVLAEFCKWKNFNKLQLKRRRKRLKPEPITAALLVPDQLSLLLEWLLEIPVLYRHTVKALGEAYSLDQQNPDVRHRWCEILVKHNYSSGFPSVRRFLLEDQAMGVYLYGELVLSQKAEQLQLAKECFSLVEEHMDPSHRTIVREMFGLDS